MTSDTSLETTFIAMPAAISLALIGLLCFVVLSYLRWEFTVGSSRRALITNRGCKPIKENDEYYNFPNRIFGIKVLKEIRTAISNHTLLERTQLQFKRHGLTFRFRILFTDIVETIEVENIKSILATNFKDWNLPTLRKLSFAPLLGNGIFTNDGAAWQHSRQLVRPNFTKSQVGDVDIFEKHVSHLIKTIPQDGSAVDLQDLFFLLTLDSATEFLFGESTNCLAQEKGTELGMKFADAFNFTQQEIMGAFRTGTTRLWVQSKKFKADVKFINNFADRIIRNELDNREKVDAEKATSYTDDRYVFLRELVQSTNDPLRVRSELLNILLAGRDTTASLLADVFFVLARRQDIWLKLQAEIAMLQNQRPTYEQIKDLRYLRMVLNETLRLYPVVPFNGREAATDTVLPLGGGEDGKSPLFVPKGQIVRYSVYALQRRRDLYGEDAEEFKPERWETIRPGWVSIR